MYRLISIAFLGFILFQDSRSRLIVDSNANYIRAVGATHTASVNYSDGDIGSVVWWYNMSVNVGDIAAKYKIARLFVSDWMDTNSDSIHHDSGNGLGVLKVTYSGTTRIMQMTIPQLTASNDGVSIIVVAGSDRVNYTLNAKHCNGTKSTNNPNENTDKQDGTFNSNATIECVESSRLYKGYTPQNEREFNVTCEENAEWINHENYACLSAPDISPLKLEYTEGDDLTFECMVQKEGYPPTKSFIYYFEGNSMTARANTPVSFRQLQASDHFKTISCFAVSNLTENTREGNRTYNIIVQYEPRNIFLTCNKDATLEITFESNPSVQPSDVYFRMKGTNKKIYPTNDNLTRNGNFKHKFLINNMLNFSFETKFEFGWNYSTKISSFTDKRDLECKQEQTTDFLIAAIAGVGGGLLLILTIILVCLLYSKRRNKERSETSFQNSTFNATSTVEENVKEEVTNPVYGMTSKGAEKEERINPIYAGSSSGQMQVDESYAEVKKDRKENKNAFTGSSKDKESEAYSGAMEIMYASVDTKQNGMGAEKEERINPLYAESSSGQMQVDESYAEVKKDRKKNKKGSSKGKESEAYSGAMEIMYASVDTKQNGIDEDINKPSSSTGHDQNSTYATVMKTPNIS